MPPCDKINFHLLENIFISPLFLKDIITGHRIQFCSCFFPALERQPGCYYIFIDFYSIFWEFNCLYFFLYIMGHFLYTLRSLCLKHFEYDLFFVYICIELSKSPSWSVYFLYDMQVFFLGNVFKYFICPYFLLLPLWGYIYRDCYIVILNTYIKLFNIIIQVTEALFISPLYFSGYVISVAVSSSFDFFFCSL